MAVTLESRNLVELGLGVINKNRHHNALLVPIHLDALFLEQPETVLGATADFTRLPYFDGAQLPPYDQNANTPYTGDNIVSPPFRDKNLKLQAGIHLHWALPDALTQGVNTEKGVVFPLVPDRWLVTRTGYIGKNNKEKMQWIVESDYLHPDGHTPVDCVNFPLPPRPADKKWQPFRYLGRNWIVGDGEPSSNSGAEYLNRLAATAKDTLWKQAVAGGLTAIGYGEPSFAAFYPNCRSVFGLHDSEIASDKDFKSVTYDIVGWFDEPAQDCLLSAPFKKTLDAVERRFINEFQTSGFSGEAAKIDHAEVWHAALGHHYQWAVSKKVSAGSNDAERGVKFTESAKRTFCYARLKPAADANFKSDPATSAASIDLAIGNTAREALSAHLANAGSSSNSATEEQLEALHLGKRLEDRQIDIGPKFREARHNKGFKSIRSGTSWSIRLERVAEPSATKTAKEDLQAHTTDTLPTYLAHTLNRLNVAQGAFQRAHEHIGSLRKEIYHDWTLFMKAQRPPELLSSGYPDSVEIASFIEKTGLKTLRRELAATGDLKLKWEETGKDQRHDPPIIGVTVSPGTKPTALAHRVAENVAEVIDGLTTTNKILTSLNILDGIIAEKSNIGKKALSSFEQKIRSFFESQTIPYSSKKLDLPTLRHGVLNKLSSITNNAEHEKFATDVANLLTCLFEGLSMQVTDLPVITKMHYTLRQIGGPRYYKPTDPVVLMSGRNLKPTDRHGTDGTDSDDGKLKCMSLNNTEFPPVREWKKKVPEQIEAIRTFTLKDQPDGDQIGTRHWRKQPWHPFLMEWQVEMLPVNEGSNRDEHRQSYAAQFVTQNYSLPENSVDLVIKHEADAEPQLADTGVYTGSCVLVDHAPELLKNDLHRYLKMAQKTETANIETVKRLKAVLKTLNNSSNTLSQSLDGFSEALLQRHQSLQLPIEDPIGFENLKPLTDNVRAATQGRHSNSPLRDNDFTPIRSGKMKLGRLRLVDTFGRVKSVVDERKNFKISVCEMLRTSDPQEINLPPRILQAARLNFRWLSSEHASGITMDEPETNEHPATTPICGWIVPNNLDRSLMVYDTKGKALGTIIGVDGDHVAWQSAPGSDVHSWELINAQSALMNPHLRKLVNTFVNKLGKRDTSFHQSFLATVNNALENIAPEDFSHHDSLAVLMGRPIAVVRGMVDLELRGRPAVNQKINVFWRDMLGAVGSNHKVLSERRAQFTLSKSEQSDFITALEDHNVSKIRSVFEKRSIDFPPQDSDILITANALEGSNGRWKIQTPMRDYVVRQHATKTEIYLSTDRTTDSFTHVKFPVRIGEFQQLNDGLVGYFIEDVDGHDYHYKDNCFYAPQAGAEIPLDLDATGNDVQEQVTQLDNRTLPTAIGNKLQHPDTAIVTIDKTGLRWRIDTNDHVYNVARIGDGFELKEMLDSSSDHIKVHWKDPVNVTHSIDDPPLKLTMLIDPQGPVHAVSGILPTKSISIPREQYAQALRDINIHFLSTPILTEREKVKIPLTAEAGHEWSWLTRQGEAWSETSEINRIDTKASFTGPQRIIEGWLKLKKEHD